MRSIFLACTILLLPGLAHALPPTDAEVIFVRKDCTSFFAPSMCVTSMADVTTWLPTRVPANNPVLVNVGPGDWDSFDCVSQDFVTIRGSGRDVTRILRTDTAQKGAIDVDDCAALAVENLTAHGSFAGVQWNGGGSSTWSDVDLLGGGSTVPSSGLAPTLFSIGWYDKDTSAGCGHGEALHYFFGSRVTALGNALQNDGYVARCSEVWFFGGEIQATSDGDTPGSMQQTAVLLNNHAADFRVFGSALRSNPGAAVSNSLVGVGQPELTAVAATLGEFHMHGGIINVNANGSTQTVSVMGLLTSANTVRAHTPGTGWVALAANGGTAARVSGPNAKTQTPFLWQQGSEPPRSVPGDPTSAFVTSIQGSDLFVETDCVTGGSCSGGSDPHLMLYSEACAGTGGPWFDVVEGACRN